MSVFMYKTVGASPALRFNKRQIDKKGFQKGIRPFCRSGGFGNPIERVPDGSFPHFCPHRNGVPARHERITYNTVLVFLV